MFVSALRGRDGTSAAVLDRCLSGADLAIMGAALLAEHEEPVKRSELWIESLVTLEEREMLLDDLCAAARW